jgi:hypothetical protein|tara:strand:- start:63 stop:575 length:513 start_codon:yes stop_codon:yes gene_type:complete
MLSGCVGTAKCIFAFGCIGTIKFSSLNAAGEASPITSVKFVRPDHDKIRFFENEVLPGDLLEVKMETGDVYYAEWPPQSREIEIDENLPIQEKVKLGQLQRILYLAFKSEARRTLECHYEKSHIRIYCWQCKPSEIVLECSSDKGEAYEIRYQPPYDRPRPAKRMFLRDE